MAPIVPLFVAIEMLANIRPHYAKISPTEFTSGVVSSSTDIVLNGIDNERPKHTPQIRVFTQDIGQAAHGQPIDEWEPDNLGDASREVASISKVATKGYLSVNAIEVFRQLDTIFFRRIDGGSLQDDQLTPQFTHLKHVFQQCSPMRRLPVCLNRLLKIAPKCRIAREYLDKRSQALLVKLKVNGTECIASGDHFT
jgi:hypothetical protein